jgi:hypothetical protein
MQCPYNTLLKRGFTYNTLQGAKRLQQKIKKFKNKSGKTIHLDAEAFCARGES